MKRVVLALAVLAGAEQARAQCASPYVCTTGDQQVNGTKVFEQAIVIGKWDGSPAQYPMVVNGVPIQAYPNKDLRLLGALSVDNPNAAVAIGSSVRRDGGILELRNGPNHEHAQFNFGDNLYLSCSDAATTGQCSIVDATGVPGHVAVSAGPQLYLTLRGRLFERRDGFIPDGGCDVDGGDTLEADGGCHPAFTPPHGDHVLNTSGPRKGGGLIIEAHNYGTASPKVWFVDVWGGTGTLNYIPRHLFPPCPAWQYSNGVQQDNRRGSIISTTRFASDVECDFQCISTGWRPSKDCPPSDGGW